MNDGDKCQLNTLLSQNKRSLDPEGCSTSLMILDKFLNFSEPQGPPLLEKEIEEDFSEDTMYMRSILYGHNRYTTNGSFIFILKI